MAAALRDRLEAAMREEFGDDRPRIDHALTVLGYAERIRAVEGGDEAVLVAAGLLHDIGIQEAERKHGSSAGRYQEVEGPPIARRILSALDVDAERTDHVCRIVANHHSARDIDTLEFRILWDADWLVNLPGAYPDAGPAEIEGHVERLFKTAAGKAVAREVFLG